MRGGPGTQGREGQEAEKQLSGTGSDGMGNGGAFQRARSMFNCAHTLWYL